MTRVVVDLSGDDPDAVLAAFDAAKAEYAFGLRADVQKAGADSKGAAFDYRLRLNPREEGVPYASPGDPLLLATPAARRALPALSHAACNEVAAYAWVVRGNARLIGKTAVGCAVQAASTLIHVGCNVEHKYRAHCVHAEANALTTMTGAGDSGPGLLLIAAERDFFTPCGGCMDWIMELGGPDTVVAFQGAPGGPIRAYAAHDLMPHYPR